MLLRTRGGGAPGAPPVSSVSDKKSSTDPPGAVSAAARTQGGDMRDIYLYHATGNYLIPCGELYQCRVEAFSKPATCPQAR